MIQNLSEKYRSGIDSLVGNGCIGGSQFQVGSAVGQTAKSLRCTQILRGQCSNAEIFCIFQTELRADSFHQAADSDNVHRVNNSVPDTGISRVFLTIPVVKGFISDTVNRIVINGS